MTRRAILTAGEMRRAEAEAIAGGTAESVLMERAGEAAAEAIWRFAGPLPALILCGPGNNGGDGYVIARVLAERGAQVRVAALGEPATETAQAARARWQGPVEPLADAGPAPLLIDALFGTGLRHPLNPALAGQVARLAAAARVRVAVDLPSGVTSDDGAILSAVPAFDLTVTFATLKPAHLLQPAAALMGRVVVADIRVAGESLLHEIARPLLSPPGPADHKFTRGYVAVLAGEMPGAAGLAAAAALRGGAGYVRLVGEGAAPGLPSAIVRSDASAASVLADPRVGAAVVGPGLGRGDGARALLQEALASDRPLVLDTDALALAADAGPQLFARARHMPVLTPHGGEFARLFGAAPGGKVEQARQAARASGAVIVHKGADTVVAAPDGQAAIAPAASHWLATAGTGDVLAGIIGAMRARGMEAFDAACAGVWLYGRAAAFAGPGLIADDLPAHLPRAVAECR
ncbi:MAG TPA: NAD(P)H-hydrate dehydratase [Allosphingosinicella sp.]|nr:NAD(P)H-hydrate dehydratase [Allosphingosinicella sp.]